MKKFTFRVNGFLKTVSANFYFQAKELVKQGNENAHIELVTITD